jgi:LPXTG-motif cell wall-anchored protein
MKKYLITLAILLLFSVFVLGAVNVSANVLDSVAPTTSFSGCTPGWHNTDQNITLTCADNNGGSGCSLTKYRLNSAAWLTYSTPFALNSDFNFKVDYNSKDVSGNIEAIKTSYCAVDKTPPITSISGCIAGTSQITQNLSLTCADPTAGCNSTSYQIDSGATTPYTGIFTLNTDGNHQIDFNSIDRATNQEITKTSYCYINSAPQIVVIQPNGSEVFTRLFDSPTIILSLQDAENESLFVDLNYSTSNSLGTGTPILLNEPLTSENILCEDSNFKNFVNCYYSWNLTGVPDGNYYLNAVVRDADKNDSDSTDSVFVIQGFPSVTDSSEDYNNRFIQPTAFFGLSAEEKQNVFLQGIDNNIMLIGIIIVLILIGIGWFLWRKKQNSWE